LKQWRNKYGFSQDEAAETLEMSKEAYVDVEYGYKQPNHAHWQKVVLKHLRDEVKYKTKAAGYSEMPREQS
jgi:predicted transcriptional regulator